MPNFEGLRKIIAGDRSCEQILASLLDDLPIGILILDKNGMPLFMNRAALRIYGEMPVGSSRVFQPSFRMTWADGSPIPPEVLPFYRIPQRDEVFSPGEIKLAWPDGRERYLLLRGVPISEDGSVLGAMFLSLDITERKKIELALRESEERFRITFEQAAVGIAHVAMDGRFLRVNQRFCDIVGYSREELRALTFRDITHPEDLETDAAQADLLMRGLIRTYSMDKRYVRKDGSLVWVTLTGSLARTREGAPDYLIGVVQDIGERKQAERLLQQERDFVSAILDTMGSLLIVLDLEGMIVRFNSASERVSGYREAELLGKPLWILIPPEEQAALRENFHLLSTGNVPSQHENHWLSKDGSRHWISWSATALRNEQGEISFILGTGLDQTEKKMAEDAFRASQQRYETLVNSVDGIVWEADAQTLHFRFVSPQAERILGFPPSQWLEEPHFWRDHLHPEDRDSAIASCTAATARGEGHALEYRMIAADGRTVWLRDTVSVETVEGVPTTLRGIMVDITERERQRQQREQIEALKQADALKDQFLSMVSHELRTPINVITGFGSMLEDEISGPLNPEQQRFIQRILGGADLLLGLVNDLLDMTRIQAGRFALSKGPMRFSDTVDEVLQSYAPVLQRKHLTLVKEVAPDLPVMMGDEQRVSQILFNLLSNAVKFTPPGGTICFRVYRVGDSVVCEVHDSGVGIAPEDLPRLFQRFTRLAQGVQGTGLGLSIAKALVEAHGGTITAESPGLGQGSCFRFSLPLA